MEEGAIIEHRKELDRKTTPRLKTLLILSGECVNLAVDGMVEHQTVLDTSQQNGGQSIWSFSMQVAYYMGDLEKATKMAEKLSHIR